MSQDVTPASLTPTHDLPVLPYRSHPDAPAIPIANLLGRYAGSRRTVEPDAVKFDAECPGCGMVACWHGQREDTRTEFDIDCRICDQRARRRLPMPA